MPTANLFSLVQQVANEHRDLLNTNINATCFQFIQLVLARTNDPEWGHVGKTAGEGQYTPPGFVAIQVGPHRITGVSHDAIFHKGANQQVDLLGGGNNGPNPIGPPAREQWNPIPPEFYRPNNPWLPAIPLSGSGSTPAPGPPAPPQPLTVVPNRAEALDELHFLDSYYSSAEGLQRANGLSQNGKPEFNAVAAWYLDVYQ